MNSMHTICNTRVRLAACTCPCPGVQRREASCPADRVYNPRAFHCGYTTIRKHWACWVCWVCARGRAAPTLRRNTHNTRNTQTCTIRKCVHAVAPHRLSDAIHTIHAIHKHLLKLACTQCMQYISYGSCNVHTCLDFHISVFYYGNTYFRIYNGFPYEIR